MGTQDSWSSSNTATTPSHLATNKFADAFRREWPALVGSNAKCSFTPTTSRLGSSSWTASRFDHSLTCRGSSYWGRVKGSGASPTGGRVIARSTSAKGSRFNQLWTRDVAHERADAYRNLAATDHERADFDGGTGR